MEMGADDLASDARKEDNQKIREHATWEAERGQKGQGTTDQFQCAKCRQRKCTYYVRCPCPIVILAPFQIVLLCASEE
jgi:transcription elongation factor S-II